MYSKRHTEILRARDRHRHVTIGSLAMVVAFVAICPRLSIAQTPDSLSGVTTDTGTFAPGHLEFSRYRTPGMCRAAALNVRDERRRLLDVQLAQYMRQGTVIERIQGAIPPSRDTLPPAAIAIARRCGSRFAVASTAPQDMRDLQSLALLQGNDTLANRVVEHLHAGAKDDSARILVLTNAIMEYLNAEPSRDAAADALVARIDAMGPSARLAQRDAHDLLLTSATRELNRVRMRREAERMIALVRSPAEEDVTSASMRSALIGAYGTLAALALADAPDSVNAVATRFIDDLEKTATGKRVLAALQIRTPADAVALLVHSAGEIPGLHGKPAPSLTAQYWFAPGETISRPQSWPVPGRLSLLLTLGAGNGTKGLCLQGPRNDGLGMVYSYSCYRLFMLAKEWVQRYGAAGLSITLVTGTEGSTLFSGPQTAAQEAETLRWYFHEYLKVPITLAVQERPITTLPAPDLRISRGDPAFVGTYQNASTVLAGPDGRIIFAASDDFYLSYKVMLDAILARVTRTADPPAVSSHSPVTEPAAHE